MADIIISSDECSSEDNVAQDQPVGAVRSYQFESECDSNDPELNMEAEEDESDDDEARREIAQFELVEIDEAGFFKQVQAMASAADRREARRQKILQNSENRMKRLLGEKTDAVNVRETLNIEAESEKVASTDTNSLHRRLHEPDIVQSKELRDEVSATSSPVPEGDIPRLLSAGKGSPTVKIQKLSPVPNETNEHAVNDKAAKAAKARQPKPEDLWKILDLLRFGAMILLAIIVRWLLSYGFGLFYVKSIFIPFIATEIAIYAFQQINMQNVVLPHKGSLLPSALMLCGIKPDVIKVYNSVMGYVTAISEDCAIYLFTFVLCNIFMALPEE